MRGQEPRHLRHHRRKRAERVRRHLQRARGALRLYSKKENNNDTTYAFSVVKQKEGYLFVFPEDTTVAYKQINQHGLRFDTILLRTQSSFGPYKFIRQGKKILFKDISRAKRFEDLYEIKGIEFYSPELFSTNTDSYNILTQMLDSNSVVQIGANRVVCFKYLQILDYHYKKTYRVLYINKKSLLPYRLEYYNDSTLKTLLREVFVL